MSITSERGYGNGNSGSMKSGNKMGVGMGGAIRVGNGGESSIRNNDGIIINKAVYINTRTPGGELDIVGHQNHTAISMAPPEPEYISVGNEVKSLMLSTGDGVSCDVAGDEFSMAHSPALPCPSTLGV